MNLEEMLRRLFMGVDLSEIQHLKGQFDIVTATFAIDVPQKILISGKNCRLVCRYFAKENGFIYVV